MGEDAGRDLTLRAGALRLAARAWGPAGGRPVLALHGWLDNAASFEALAPLLAGCHVVALDLPGHGLSEHRPAGARYHFVDYVDDALAAADALGWRHFALLGHSLGGAVASFVAGTRPERVERLALLEALGPLTVEAGATAAVLRRALDSAARAGARAPARYASVDAAVDARCAAGDLSPPAARGIVERGTRAEADGVRWRADPRLRLPSPQYFTEEQVLAVLRAIRAPTRLVVADRGLLAAEAVPVEDRLDALAGIGVRRLAGHHHLHLESPRAVAATLAPLLSGAEP